MPPTDSPFWPLETVKALVATNAFTLNRAATLCFDTRVEAEAAFIDIVKGLTPAGFSQKVVQAQKFDVYGVNWGGRGWYVKFTIETPSNVLCISLHYPERPMRTQGGAVIK